MTLIQHPCGCSLVGCGERVWRRRVWAVVFAWLFVAGFAHGADRSVAINEIMYHPPGGATNLQWVELFNVGTNEVDLSNWAFSKGIDFTFPVKTRLGGQAYLVVCRDQAAFAAHYGPAILALGPFKGKLSRKSERLQLTDAHGQVIDSVKYSDSEEWPRGADGLSSSLERICPTADSDLPANWASSNLPARKTAAGTPGRQNDAFAPALPPVISAVEFSPRSPNPQQAVKVSSAVADAAGVKEVLLLYRVAGSSRESDEMALPMSRVSGDTRKGAYEATIPAQAQGQLVRFRIRAVSSDGTERVAPSENEPRPTFTYCSIANGAKAGIPVGFLVNIGRMSRGPGHYQPGPARRPPAASSLRGNGAFVYFPAESDTAEVYDYVRIASRHGGYKVHFQKDRALKGMTGINLISEGSIRWILAEPLAYVLYRMAGVPAPLTEHVRLSLDGRPLGFHLLVEQPNKSFLARNGRDDSGNLYKLIWYGQGVVGQHEKKTNPGTGHADIVQLIDDLRRKSGAQQWAFIQQNFNVEECINYYAVNMCIQNWDGFFNNYYTFHDTANTGKWEIYPWDEDKTWGEYDGASSRYDWYTMPLTFGMNGDNSPRGLRQFGGGPFGGASWWRPPGYFSGPLLANPQFRQQFLSRLREICLTVFTEENFFPIIRTMEQRLEPEVRLWAQARRQDPRQAVREFASDMQSFRNQVQNRRKFILSQLGR